MTAPAPAPAAPARRFRILSLLGTGGFGRVYRARLEQDDGFRKTVAIKLLRSGAIPDKVLGRFRDEARVLGMINDRAVVGVDQPTQLDGRWAIVMEWVDGVTVRDLLRSGPIPPQVAIAVVGEIARALHKVYHLPDDDGEPLRVVHRDLKAANVALTREGDVKILDFGIAHGQFMDAPASQDTGVSGTLGYIAPERFDGVEGPEGDMYSLGVMLFVMLTNQRATRLDRSAQIDEPKARAAQALAVEMSAVDAAERPSAHEVHRRCTQMVARMPGPHLAEWAEATVPRAQAEVAQRLASKAKGRDSLIERILPEGGAEAEVQPDRGDGVDEAPATSDHTSDTARTAAPVVVGGMVGLVGLSAGMMMVAAALGLLFAVWLRPFDDPPDRPVPEPVALLPEGALAVPVPSEDPIDAAVEPVEPPVDVPMDVPVAPPIAAPVRPRPRPRPRPSPRPAPAPPATAAPAPAPAVPPVPSARAVAVRVLFDPPGARVFVDGVHMADTAGSSLTLKVDPGSREFRFVDGPRQRAITRTVTVGGSYGNTLIEWSGDALLACRPAAGQGRCQ